LREAVEHFNAKGVNSSFDKTIDLPNVGGS
jgi:hypothetical protein